VRVICRTIGRFFSWWTRELKAILPSSLQVQSSPVAVVLELGERTIVAWRLKDHSRVRLAEVHRTSLQAEGGEGTELAAGRSVLHRVVDPDETPVLLQLPHDKTLRRIVELPRVALENLSEVLSFEMYRLTPFRAEEVYCTHRVADERAADPDKVAVEITVVPRLLVDPLLTTLLPWTLRVADTTPKPIPRDDRDAGVYLALVPTVPRPTRQSYGCRLLWATNFAFAVAAVMVPFVQQERTLSQLASTLEDSRARALATQRERIEADRLVSARQFLIDRKRDATSVTQVLSDLTTALPDSTSLQRLQVRDNQVTVKGVSNSASSLIKLIEDTALFQEARFTAPITRNPTTGVESFQLVFDLSPRMEIDDASNEPGSKQGIGAIAAGIVSDRGG
jgi:general secretion pathway protein L